MSEALLKRQVNPRRYIQLRRHQALERKALAFRVTKNRDSTADYRCGVG